MSYLGQENTQLIPPMHVGDTIVTNDKEKADCINQHVMKASDLDDRNSEIPFFNLQTNNCQNSLNCIKLTEPE